METGSLPKPGCHHDPLTWSVTLTSDLSVAQHNDEQGVYGLVREHTHARPLPSPTTVVAT